MNLPYQSSSYNGTGISQTQAVALVNSALEEESLRDLDDVDIPEIIDNLKLLQYNSTSQKWEATNGIDQASSLHSIFTTKDVGGGEKALLSSDLYFQKTGDTSLMYIYDSVNNNIPLQFSATQDNIDTNNNTVSISVDNTASSVLTLKGNKVGIGVTDPEEELEVDGSIQIDSANVARLKFQQSGGTPHSLGEIDGEQDGTNGGTLEFYTKVDGGATTEKLRINNVGALGIGGANFGNAGQVIVSNGSGNAIEWVNPVDELGDLSDVNTSGLIAEGDVLTLHNAGQNPEYRIKPIPDQIQPALTNLTGGKIVASADLLGEKSLIDSNITTGVNTTSVAGNLTIDSTLTANSSTGTAGQVLTSNGSSPAYWADASAGLTPYYLRVDKDGHQEGLGRYTFHDVINWTYSLSTSPPFTDYSADFNMTTGFWTCPATGVYYIYSSVTCRNGSQDVNSCYARFMLNTTTQDTLVTTRLNSANSDFENTSLVLANVFTLTANDTINLQVRIDTGFSTSDVRDYSYISIYRIA